MSAFSKFKVEHFNINVKSSVDSGRIVYFENTLKDDELFVNLNEYQSKIDSDGFSAICFAASKGIAPEVIALLSDFGFSIAKCKRGKTPLQIACQSMNTDVVKALLGDTIVYNVCNYIGEPVNAVIPLEDFDSVRSHNKSAVFPNDLLSSASLTEGDIFILLLNSYNGGDATSIKDSNGNNLLMIACSSQCYDSVDAILLKNPNLSDTNNDDKTAFDIARENGDIGILEKLGNYVSYTNWDGISSYSNSHLKHLIDNESYSKIFALFYANRFNSFEIEKIKLSIDPSNLPDELK